MYTRPLSAFVHTGSTTAKLNIQLDFLYKEVNSSGGSSLTSESGVKTNFDAVLDGINRYQFEEEKALMVIGYKQQLGASGMMIYKSNFQDLINSN